MSSVPVAGPETVGTSGAWLAPYVTFAVSKPWSLPFLHVTVYVVVWVGVMSLVPEVGEPGPVEKFVPVHDVASVDDQVRVIGGSPWRYESSEAVRSAVGSAGLLIVTVFWDQPE